MPATSENNKRIAKNTLMLYFRMFILMAVGLFTSRVILDALGVEDFGIYNVVGGVVGMFSILSGSLSSAIGRFITFELGRGDNEKLARVFSSAITIQAGLAIIIIILAEIVGVWFLNTKMVIPDTRMTAANWVFHLSLLNFGIGLISVPYNACIIAHEHMSAFAYISIWDVVCKLLFAYLISISPIDRLIFFAILSVSAALISRFIYACYCKRHFEECTCHFIWDKVLLKQMFGFAGWNFIGASSAVLRDQGGNIVINLFFGPTVNAARGIASQVNGAIQRFVSSFMTALNPQITKSYAAGDREYMMTLIHQGARFSFYLLLLLSLPVLINTHYILNLWLKVVPEHTVLFVQLTLIFSMSESISNPLVTAMLATGKIRNYQIVVGGLQMMNLPVSYVLLRSGAIPEAVIMVAIIISQCCLAARLYMLKGMIQLEIRKYLQKVYFNVIIVSLIAAILPFFLHQQMEENLSNFCLSSICCILCTSVTIYYIGCNYKERAFVRDKIHTLTSKFRHR